MIWFLTNFFKMQIPKEVLSWLPKYLRYTDYLSAAQLYLKDNFFLKEKLKAEHVKERVLGHWGTCPGLNVIYAHLNYLIYKHQAEILFICGPGHGAPAVLSNLFAEGTLTKYYPELTRDEKGTGDLLKRFSWPKGFPSHVTPMVPGSILEGGELGYSLSTAYGSILDNPNLISACVIGDGEAESGPLAAAWNANKFVNPKSSGAVLPILHVNGYKISNPTIYGLMSDEEIKNLFSGFGYHPIFVEDNDTIHDDMISALEQAYQEIKQIWKNAREKGKILKPRWPMIVFRNPKGQTGIKSYHGTKIEGSFHSHGIPLTNPAYDHKQLEAVEKWLKSYKIEELIDKNGSPKTEILKFVPKEKYSMGQNKHAFGGKIKKDLKLPDSKNYQVKCERKCRGQCFESNTYKAGEYLRDIFKLNKKEQNFRFFCPDETESNKLQAIFEETKRAYTWPVAKHDENINPDGRVTEMLSEHTLQGMYEGYVLTGRHGLFATYEAFAPIISSMIDQYAKFIKQSMRMDFRPPVASMNILLTSSLWRQEHNGYSHQNPGFIANVLLKHGAFSSVYLPPDANSLIVALEDCFKRTDCINAIVASKQKTPQWLSLEEAKKQLETGIMVWEWVGGEGSKNPDIVIASAGDYVTYESLAAVSLLKEHIPELKIRFVNVSELTALGVGDECHSLGLCEVKRKDFNNFFTEDKPIIFTFHGYPAVIQQLIFGHEAANRISIHGYNEEGTTTTPFDMQIDNKTSRFHIAIDVLQKMSKENSEIKSKANKLIMLFEQKIKDHSAYIVKYGKDMEEISQWCWKQ